MGIGGKGEEVARSAIFVDRDGTIIEQREVLTKPSEVRVIPGVAEAIAELKRRGYLVIGITNQPNIEKGLVTLEETAAIHAALQKQLNRSGGCLDALYTCPHKFRPEGQCNCRKPGPGLLEEAQAAFPIDMTKSWLIGDRLRDVETGRRLGLRTLQVGTGGPNEDDAFFSDAKPDYYAADLAAAIAYIL